MFIIKSNHGYFLTKVNNIRNGYLKPPLLLGKGGSASVGSPEILADITPEWHPVDTVKEDVTEKIIKHNSTSLMHRPAPMMGRKV